ncbi:TIGR01777 family protein [Psychrobacter sp. NG254]|uniref:TIGR01777 family oxidoreductase n=1 Tax=Psychrobacter sp. NG254 TaxID=2782003 RepID=UPI001888ABF8|nr:TIGR01777 family oxidoreductase [Psychrobacter sp. NG254]MBF2718829.1 TIGR01777 family protein [Psychrobacter sp. NG254]
MNILISGGSGFLGSAFSKELQRRYQQADRDLNVTWLTRDSSQAHPDNINMMTYEELATSDMSFDVIVNLAGAGIADARWSDERKEQLLASRIKPTESLLAFIARTSIKPKLLVSGSAIGWYGTQGDKPLTESSDYESDFAHTLCNKWEQLAVKATQYNVPVAIVRTGVVIHPEGGMLGKLLTPFKIGVGGQLADGQQIMSWISREDWVAATIFIIEQQLVGKNDERVNALQTANNTPALVYNLTAPNPVTNHTFTKTLGAWLHRPTFFTLPTFLLKLMFGEMSTLLIDGQKVLPKALESAGYEFRQPTLKQALEIQK